MGWGYVFFLKIFELCFEYALMSKRVVHILAQMYQEYYIQFKTAYIGLYMPQDLHSNFSWEEKVTKRTLALYNRQAVLSVVELGRLQVCGDIGYPLSLSTQKKKRQQWNYSIINRYIYHHRTHPCLSMAWCSRRLFSGLNDLLWHIMRLGGVSVASWHILVAFE